MNKFVPLRNFIFDRLYDPAGGYFCRKDYQVGQLSSPIDFKTLIGFDDYQQQLFKRYPKNAWLTPSQIFKPYYGMSIANYINQAQTRYKKLSPCKDPIRIVEAGAGTGSAAQSILFYFQNFQKQIFKNIQYNIVEISPTLCHHMQKKLKTSFPYLMQKGQIKIHNKDIFKYSNPNRCYTIFLEVLDNLPHDKIIKHQSDKYNKYSTVNLQTKEERYQDIDNDKLIKQCLELYLKFQKFKQNQPLGNKKGFFDRMTEKIFVKFYTKKTNTQQLFLPTQMFNLLKTFKVNVPEAHLIMSDFDNLISNIGGINAPIVSFKGERSAEKQDFDTYLVDRGSADIFFPVDFQFLRYLHGVTLGQESDLVKSHEFFEQFGLDNWTVTKSGYNPLKQDFGNTSFLLTKI